MNNRPILWQMQHNSFIKHYHKKATDRRFTVIVQHSTETINQYPTTWTHKDHHKAIVSKRALGGLGLTFVTPWLIKTRPYVAPRCNKCEIPVAKATIPTTILPILSLKCWNRYCTVLYINTLPNCSAVQKLWLSHARRVNVQWTEAVQVLVWTSGRQCSCRTRWVPLLCSLARPLLSHPASAVTAASSSRHHVYTESQDKLSNGGSMAANRAQTVFVAYRNEIFYTG